jgi:hypothetical protein
MYTYIHIYIYIERERERQRHRQRDRETELHTQREKETEREKERERERENVLGDSVSNAVYTFQRMVSHLVFGPRPSLLGHLGCDMMEMNEQRDQARERKRERDRDSASSIMRGPYGIPDERHYEGL